MIDGGAGTDTLNIYVNGTHNQTQQGTVRNVEIINIFNAEAATQFGGNDVIRADRFEGAEQIWQIDGSNGISRLAETTTAGFRGDKEVDVTLTAANAAESVNVALDMADVSNENGDNIVGGNAVVDLTVAGNNLNAINLGGELNFEGTTACGNPTMIDGAVELNITNSQAAVALNTVFNTTVNFATNDDLEALDASASTGDITVNGLAQLTDITTGTGNDVVTSSANTTTVGDVTITTGEGNDTINAATSGEGTTTINAGNSGDGLRDGNTINLNNASETVVINGGDNKDTLNISSTAFNNAEELTVDLGAGNDSVTINGVLADLNSNWSIDGGAGTDSVTINVATGRTFEQGDYTALTDNLVNFEQLVLKDTGENQEYTVDASRMTGYEQFGFEGNGIYNITDVTDQLITLKGDGTLDVTADGFDGDDEDNIVYGGDVRVEATNQASGNTVNAQASNLDLTVATSSESTVTGELETLNVALESEEVLTGDCPETREVTDVTTSSVVVDTTSTLRNLTDVTLTGQGSATITNVSGAALETVDASGLSAIAWDDIESEVVVGEGLNYTTDNGDVAETIILSEGLDTITFGSATASTVAKTDVVEGLNLVESEDTAGELDDALTDMITVEGITTFATLSESMAAEVAGRSTFNLALQQVAQDSTEQYVAFHYGNDTYIYGDFGGAEGAVNNQVDDADMLIKLTGVQDLDLLTASLNADQQA